MDIVKDSVNDKVSEEHIYREASNLEMVLHFEAD